MKQLGAPLFLALCVLQTLFATPAQAEFAAFSASNLPLASIQRAQAAIDLVVNETSSSSGIVAGVDSSQNQQASRSSGTFLGIAPSGLSTSVTLFSKTRTTQDGTSQATTAAASTVGSLGGNVNIKAGQAYTQTGSDVLAPKGDIGIRAQTVDITEARESRADTAHQTSKSVTVGATPRNAVVDLLTSTKGTLDTAQATTQTGNTRMQALGAAATALSAVDTANKAAALAQNPASAASVSIEFSVGSQKSQSSSTQTAHTGRGSNVAAGGDVHITATGAGAASNLTVRGSEISAGNNAHLKADGDLKLTSSQDTAHLDASNKSTGGSIGVGISFGSSTGITLNASANAARGNANGQDTVQRNTHVVAGNTVNLQSGADTTLAGATVTAPTVHAQVGGNLNIESRQDTSSYDSQQKSAGAGVSLCIPPLCYGASSVSGSAAAQNIESTLKSVGEQSGIRAGDGGFQVNVKGDTTLVGGAITSTDKAVNEGKNSFTTGGTLSTTDVQNEARYKGDGFAASITVAGGGGGEKPPEGQETRTQTTVPKTGGSAGMGEDSGNASSVTTAGISGIAGDKDKRTGDAEQGIAPIFDKDKVQKEIDAQIKITQEFGQQASTAWGEYANKQLDTAVKAGDQEAIRCWSSDGACRIAGHSIIGGLTGGVGGAAGAAASTYSAATVAQMAQDAGLDGLAANVLTALVSAGAGALAGGGAGAIGAINEVANNYLTSAQWNKLAEEIKGCGGNAACENGVRDRYLALSGKQDEELRQACKDQSSDACRSKLNDALTGTVTQHSLVKDGALSNSYLAPLDLNANAMLVAKQVLDTNIRAACAASANCTEKKEAALRALGSTILDFVPVIGDIKGFVEAETPFDYLLATIGTLGPVGDGLKKVLQEGKVLYKAGDIAGATAKLKEANISEVVGKGANGGVGTVAVDAGSVKGVNPTGSTQNCTNCVAVVDNLLTTGNPASALPRATPVPFDQLGQMYGTKLSGWTSQQTIESTLLAQGNGARAVIYGTDGATGHVWNAVVQNGKVNYIDGQIGGSGASNFKAFTNFQFGILP